ncbi:MAG TPA: NAD+ synthase [Pyrinomonadaceae bacterium]|nr:NAD+ synthase [Pyrinomonadaceae bacterium]
MKVTIGQINTTNGDIEGNLSKIINAIRLAKSEGSDLIVFPELVTHGYTSQDWFTDKDVIDSAEEPLGRLLEHTKGISAIIGTIRQNKSADGKRLFNTAAVVSDGKLIGYADKTLLPEYDVFDDPRWFQPREPSERTLFQIAGKKVGVVVCEDFWNDKTFWRERLYESDPADELIEMGAELLVAINASPYNKGKIRLRCDMVAHRARLHRIPVVFVNLVGGNDGIIFDGSSLIADHEGDIILQAASFREFVETVSIDCRLPDSRGITGSEISAIHDALVLGIHDYAAKNNFKKAVIGLSGGIDSSLVAALACEALGAENVLCVMMPSPFSSPSSVSDAEKLISNLGCEGRLIPISDAFELLTSQLHLKKPTRGGESIAAENLQSRLRGLILMAISNSENRLLLSTGNKSELAVGYCTLYGDTNGGLAVIGDVLKTEVWALAKEINSSAGHELIPAEIIQKKPSAELAPNQFDQDTLPPYEKMDPILEIYFEQKAGPEEIIAAGHDKDLVYSVLNRVEHPSNEFKRQQLPPTLIISRNAIGIGRRRPVTHKYRRK